MIFLNQNSQSGNFFFEKRFVNYVSGEQPVLRAKANTGTLREASKEFLKSGGNEKALAIAGNISNKVASVMKFVPIELGSSPDGVAKDYSGVATKKSNKIIRDLGYKSIGESHSHSQSRGHPFGLSGPDRAEIEHRREINPAQVYFLFYLETNGTVSYRAYNTLGKVIPVEVRSDATGEVRVSDDTTPKSCWGKEFWGIQEEA